ncbi:HNH endonuclease [Hoeflea sp. WL0058]|uniref:HNH endonuclease n=1 Tax=Flavimaribacter sediminis TaxID=2865987 RepID=A0AAE2ZQM8_9HYPH|nr:HNH endonuclease [Flavimaribacter sediminis]MBW8638970.1 HNH endonuclease [Flavimaribacter sediminis]
MKGAHIRYSEEELRFIKAKSKLPRRKAHAAFCKRFGRTDVTFENYHALCKRKGWKTGRTGCFEKGHVPANAGKKMPFNANSARTQFKKGNRTGVALDNWKPIGSERLTDYGYLERKIHDGMPLQSRWRAIHLINWEERHGPVPEGHCLKCLDGDKTNVDADNWECIPRAMMPRLAGRWTQGYDDAPDELKPVIMATAKLEHVSRQKAKESWA